MHLRGQTGELARALMLLACLGPCVSAQQPVPAPPTTGVLAEQTEENLEGFCFEPPPLIRMEDYHGPLARLVGILGRKAERTSVHPPHYRPGAMLCSLEPGQKFALFIRNTVDPVSFLSAVFNASLSTHSDASFGQGAAGFGKRVGAAYADETAGRLLAGFVFPTLFSEDPRYYRLGHGPTPGRLAHALEHVFVGHTDEGRRTFNFSEWLGTGSAVAVGYAWHPGNSPGFVPGARTVGISIAEDAGFDVLREFWPEIARSLRLPFRYQQPEPAH